MSTLTHPPSDVASSTCPCSQRKMDANPAATKKSYAHLQQFQKRWPADRTPPVPTTSAASTSSPPDPNSNLASLQFAAQSPLPNDTPSSSYPSSPWSIPGQPTATSSTLQQNQQAFYSNSTADGAHASPHPSSSAIHNANPHNPAVDWNAVLSAPLDSATFSILEANGALGPKVSFAQSASSSMSSQYSGMPPSMHSQSSSVGHPHHHLASNPALRDQWRSTPTPPYSPGVLSNSQRNSPSQSPQSASALSHFKGKAPMSSGVGVPHHPLMQQTRPPYVANSGQHQQQYAGQSYSNNNSANSERQQPEPKGFVNLAQHLQRPNLASRRSGQFGMADDEPMRLGMPPPPFPPHLGANSPAPVYPSSGVRAHHHPIPPSLWMSPLHANPVNNPVTATAYSNLAALAMPHVPSIDTAPSSASSSRLSSSPFVSGSASTRATSAASASGLKSPSISDILSDDLFRGGGAPDSHLSSFPSPSALGGRGSPDFSTNSFTNFEADPEQLARDDPLATQMWKLYARTKASLPHAQRMENLSWRMMALALKRTKEEEDAKAAAAAVQKSNENQRGQQQEPPESSSSSVTTLADASSSTETAVKVEPEARGRRPDKAMAKVRVVGFEGKNQDGDGEEDE